MIGYMLLAVSVSGLYTWIVYRFGFRSGFDLGRMSSVMTKLMTMSDSEQDEWLDK